MYRFPNIFDDATLDYVTTRKRCDNNVSLSSTVCVNFLQTFRDKTESSRSVEVWMASTMEQQTMVIIHDDVMMTSSEMYYPQLSIVNLSERMATPKVCITHSKHCFCMSRK